MVHSRAPGRDDEIYFHTPGRTEAFPYGVMAAGRTTAGPSEPPIRRRFNQHVLILTLAGIGEVEVEGRSFECLAGSVAWLDTSREYRHACASGSQAWSYLWFGMRGFGLDETATMLGARSNPVVAPKAGAELFLQFSEIKQRLADHHTDSEPDNSAAVASIIAALATGGAPEQSSSASLHQPMAVMIQRVRMDLGRDWAIADFSVLLGLSSSQLHRRFRKAVGSTPMDWLRRERMNAAKRLLVQTDTTISDVAAHCGYPDPLHFSREFRRVTGSSPTTFRRSRGS